MKSKYGITIILEQKGEKKVRTFVKTKNRPTDQTLRIVGDDVHESLTKEKNITVQCEAYNEISDTWMTLASYYVNENRLVHH